MLNISGVIIRNLLSSHIYRGYCVSLNRSHQLTSHGLCPAPKIYSKLHKNVHKRNSPQSERQQS